jgi:hypothetical protein
MKLFLHLVVMAAFVTPVFALASGSAITQQNGKVAQSDSATPKKKKNKKKKKSSGAAPAPAAPAEGGAAEGGK